MSSKVDILGALEELVPANTDTEGVTSWEMVAKALQKRGMTSVHGKEWTAKNVARYWERHQKQAKQNRDEIPKARETTPSEELPTAREGEARDRLPTTRETEITAVVTHTLPNGQSITDEESKAWLLELWQLHETGILARALAQGELGITREASLGEMPKIVAPKAGTSININYELRELMRAKAKEDPEYPHREGYSWTSIFTWLAWRYLECPDDNFPNGAENPDKTDKTEKGKKSKTKLEDA
jgi:hypothetical protein